MANEDINTWEFVERFYPNYSSCDAIAENDDLNKLVNGNEEIGDSAYNIKQEIISDFSSQFAPHSYEELEAYRFEVELEISHRYCGSLSKIYDESIKAYKQSTAAKMVEHFDEHVIKLASLSLIPLSTQLVRITGEEWATGNYINLDGSDKYGSKMHSTANTTILHVKTGLKFLIPDN